ncbi:MAG: site-specific integrase [Myxococcales bacterium]
MADVVQRYLRSVEFGKLKNRANEERRFRCHLLPHLGSDVAAALTLDRLSWYREQRKGEKCLNGRPGAPKAATRNRELMQLSAALSWAATYKLLPANPIRGFPLENEDSQRRTMPEPGEVDRILAASNLRLRAMLALKFGSGLRRAELCSLRLSQIDWDTGMITLHGRDTKTGRPRMTLLPARAAQLVRSYLDRRNVSSTYVFCVANGGPMHPRNFLRAFQGACKRSGVQAAEGERMCLHDLRAGFIGHQIELGTPERVIMDMSGHSTHTAFDRYVRVKAKWIVEAKARTDAFESGSLPVAR